MYGKPFCILCKIYLYLGIVMSASKDNIRVNKYILWRVGRGREPWERSEAGGVNDNERHLRHSPVSSPTEELRKE